MNIRNDFPMLDQDIIYFDNGATTFKPQCVIDAINKYYSEYCANAHRGDYKISYLVDEAYESVRDKVKSFINAKKREEIVFTSGCTESLNVIVKGFFENIIEENDEIIISKSEHASNVLPWYILSQKTGCHIKYVPLDKNLHVTLDNLKKIITPHTKVISLAHITNVVGDVRPIKEICEYAHKNNIFVVVDGAQSVPHIKTDVQDLDCDFLTFSSHKMMGPTGVGILYGKEELLNEVNPLNLGGGMNESFDDEDHVLLKSLPHRLEAGTPNIAGVIGLGSAIDYIKKIDIDKITIHEIKLKKYLIDKLEKLDYIKVVNDEAESGIVAFNVEGIFSQDVAFYLNKYNICVRAGNHCAKILKDEIGIKNTIRISLYIYNTESEIDALIELLSNKNKILEGII